MTRPSAGAAGFGLPELLVALALGITLSGVMLEALVNEAGGGLRLSRLLRERAFQRRTLELVRGDVARSVAISPEPAAESSPCGWSGRRPLLHLRLAGGAVITYAVGNPPERIWRGQVLVRCGPAYTLQGELGQEGWQNRVVIDALPAGGGLAVSADSTGSQLALRLQQVFPSPGGRQQSVSSEAVATLAAAPAQPLSLPDPPGHP